MFQILPNWHPVFVHFTVALFSISLLVFIAGFFSKSADFKQHALIVARWNFWIAVVSTIGTVIAGFIAYNSVAHDTPSHLAMTEHKNWALLTLGIILFVAVLIWTLKHHVNVFAVGLVVIVAFLSITAWHGGELVYRYGLGVMSMPQVSGEGHGHGDHEHGSSSQQQPASHHDSLAAPATDSHHDDQGGHAHEAPVEQQKQQDNVHVHSDGSAHKH